MIPDTNMNYTFFTMRAQNIVGVFLTSIWQPHSQLWAIFNETASLNWCQSLQFLLFQPKGHLELCNEIASLNLVEFELVTFLFLVQCLNPLGQSCKTQKKQETTASFTKHDLSMIKSDCLVVKTVYSSIKCYSRDQICRKRSNITPSFL